MVLAIKSGDDMRRSLASELSESDAALACGAYGPVPETARAFCVAMPPHSDLTPPGSITTMSIPKGLGSMRRQSL
ncbi:hypothetical protein AB4212_60875, partial [Streptomyces sp. 2MCAF27]